MFHTFEKKEKYINEFGLRIISCFIVLLFLFYHKSAKDQHAHYLCKTKTERFVLVNFQIN